MIWRRLFDEFDYFYDYTDIPILELQGDHWTTIWYTEQREIQVGERFFLTDGAGRILASGSYVAGEPAARIDEPNLSATYVNPEPPEIAEDFDHGDVWFVAIRFDAVVLCEHAMPANELIDHARKNCDVIAPHIARRLVSRWQAHVANKRIVKAGGHIPEDVAPRLLWSSNEVRDLFHQLLRNADVQNLIERLRMARERPDVSLLPLVSQVATEATSAKARAFAVEVLCVFFAESAIDVVCGSLADPSEKVRRAAAERLRKVRGHAEALALTIKPHLNDTRVEVACAALHAVCSTNGSDELLWNEGVLPPLLSHPHACVRLMARWAAPFSKTSYAPEDVRSRLVDALTARHLFEARATAMKEIRMTWTSTRHSADMRGVQLCEYDDRFNDLLDAVIDDADDDLFMAIAAAAYYHFPERRELIRQRVAVLRADQRTAVPVIPVVAALDVIDRDIAYLQSRSELLASESGMRTLN